MSGLLELADRVERLSGPDRDVDALIACYLRKPLGNIDHWLHRSDIPYRPTSDGYYVAELPDGRTSEGFKSKDFTASLDAAMALVPECADGGNEKWAVRLDSGFYGATALLWHECSVTSFHGHASGSHDAMSRALTAAALRARASLALDSATLGDGGSNG